MTAHADADSVETAFYLAFERCDLNAMTRLWDDAPDVTCIHPGSELLVGPAAVLDSWGQIFSQASPPVIRYRLLQKMEAPGLAIHTVEEAVQPGDQSTEPTRLIATNIYRAGDDGWHMVTHHACLPMVGRQVRHGPVH